MAIVERDIRTSEDAPRVNYLNNGYGLKSWLLTKDHKRIAVLYIISISIFSRSADCLPVWFGLN